ncbi:MAG TPA: GNAT family N-acetyltransferase [Mycobacteriales bacterium]|nr:GNAT family N-acetyltransferase [Mycobacteriales bacterium]
MTFRFAALDPQPASVDRVVAEFCADLDDAAEVERRLKGDLADRTVRLEWCWSAYDDEGDRVARHQWWGPQDAEVPVVFVSLESRDPDAAVALLEHARQALAIEEAWAPITLPGREQEADDDPWHRVPQTVAVLERGGFRFAVDRVRIEWTAGTPMPEASSRLSFRPATDLVHDELVELFAAVADGSLDDSMLRDRERLGRDAEARKRLDFDLHYPGVDGRFVVGCTRADEQPIGYVIPALHGELGVIAEIGVARPRRGRGYVHDLLAHATRVLVAAGAKRIVADTDCANTPMRAAFDRAGYRVFARRWDWSWFMD